MPSIQIPYRLLFDYSFFKEVVAKDAKSKNKPTLLTKLIIINSSSKLNRRKNNTMSAKTFLEIRGDYQHLSSETLKAAFHPLVEPENIESIEDEIERNIIHAIELKTQYPLKTIIMTSASMLSKYQKNGHIKDCEGITILADQNCVDYINTLFASCQRI